MFLGIYEKAINNKFTWEEKIIIAKQAGFDFIEFSVDESDDRLARLNWNEKTINDLKTLLVKHQFYFNSMALSGLRRYPYGSLHEKTRQKAYEITEKAIILAKKLGIRNIQLAGYDVYYEKSTEETQKYFLKGCKIAADLAMKHSMMLSFEIMDTPFMGTISKCLNILKQVPSPWLNIYPDLGNIFQWTQNLEDEFEKGKDKIIGIHFKDTKPGVFKEVGWGKGTVDFQRLINILDRINYLGPYLIEMWSKNETSELMAENVAKLKQAITFFRKFKKD